MRSHRLPRFEKSSTIPAIQLTERDLNILQMVHRHRFLSSRQIISLSAAGNQTILRRLRLLFHHGYLERPRCQLDYYNKTGSRPIVYGLGNKGAAVLKQRRVAGTRNLRWGEKNRTVGHVYLKHVLLVSEFMVRLEIACRGAGVRLLYEADLSSQETTKSTRSSFAWNVAIDGSRFRVIPDRTFGLEFQVANGSVSRSYFFLEADRGTMPIMRKDLSQASLYRKFVAYQTTWSADIHRKQFGFHRFRLLTLTTSPARVQTMIDACGKLERGRGLFLFADKGMLEKTNPPILLQPWQTMMPNVTSDLLS